MSPFRLSADPELRDLEREILELQTQVDEGVRAGQFEIAAAARDRRESLEWKLRKLASPTLLRNIELAKQNSAPRSPTAELLEGKDRIVDAEHARMLENLRLPVRWLIPGAMRHPVGTLRERLETDSLDSAYFMAHFPILSSSTLKDSKIAGSWVESLARESARNSTPIVWVCTNLNVLHAAGVLDQWWSLFEHTAFEFVAYIEDADPWLSKKVCGLSGVTVAGE